MGALRADREAILELGAGLTGADWAAGAGAGGQPGAPRLAARGPLRGRLG